ncbi:alpha/beta hydrolase [Actinoplanes oblitus]|uniref:Alpha/beta hydrolase n=1 Tax=Actinoplanes oblitus TaxID=3040509 RepID=A0ABY8WH25_9ACTN|nr:alpha/beta hydrolase [Actinoplanes oblitus]WIM97174.1 alpha/beta hydrolase [Actinoplanes oblitus]
MTVAVRVTYTRLRATDPARWSATALAWRHWAALIGVLCGEFGPLLARVRAAWSGAAADAAAARLGALRRRLVLLRLLCWRADQALSEFAAALTRARALLDRARATAHATGLTIDDAGRVAPGPAAAELATALRVAGDADESAAARLAELAVAPAAPTGSARPDCTATPAQVARWWAGLSPAERMWLLAAEPGAVAGLDGVPVADRDLANRLLLADRRDRLRHTAGTPDAAKLRGLDRLAGRLEDERGPRAYLIGLDVAGDGRAIVALGDPDHAANVLTHVPGMTADLAGLGGELTRAERVAARAGELGPEAATSSVLWLGYDAPDFLHEAWSAGQAESGATGLRRFQEGLRATHDGPAARQTVLGHSYGSLVVGKAATGALDADRVIFVGSPGVGVDSAAQLRLPADRVFASTSISDPIQYGAVSLDTAARHLVPGLPVTGPADRLWFGHNPADPEFGARVFGSQWNGGHLGYWEPGKPALDALARITLGGTP